MIPVPTRIRLWSGRFILLAAWLALHLTASAIDWPDKHELAAEASSPDGHYGILAPTMDAPEVDEMTNYLVDAKAHKVLAKLTKSHYQIGANRQGVQAAWSPDSRRCVLQFESRFGFYSVVVLELNGDNVEQYEVGSLMKLVLGQALEGKKEEIGTASAVSKFGPGGQVIFRAVGDNDPKRMDEKSKGAILQGVFDTHQSKWASISARVADMKTVDSILPALEPVKTDWENYTAEARACSEL